MGVYNRVFCPDCKKEHCVYDDYLREIQCLRCGKIIKINQAKRSFYVDYYVDGRRRREGVGSSRTLAETVLAKRKVEVAEGRFLDKKEEIKFKFNELAIEYIELHSKVNNKSWEHTDKKNVNFLLKSFSGYYLNEITPRKIEEYRAKRLKEVTPARVNRLVATLKCMFNKAKMWGRFSGDNPVTKIKMLRENNERTRFLEKEEIVKLFACCDRELLPIVIVALNTGMRLGEILGLKWQDVDMQRSMIYLYNTKNGEKREIPANSKVMVALLRIKRHPKSEYIFCLKSGRPRKHVTKLFFTALKKSGITNFHFHDLRHTFASHLVMSGVDLNTVRELLGHKSMKMTLRYSHLSPDHKKAAVDILSDRIDTFWTPELSSSKAKILDHHATTLVSDG